MTTSTQPWDDLRARMCGHTWSAEYVQLGLWAIDVLEDWLTPEWCAAMMTLGAPGSLWAMDTHRYAFCEAVELALQVNLLDKTPGLGRVRKELRNDHTAKRMYHTRLQLALAARSRRARLAVALEPGDPPTDLVIDAGLHKLNVETVTLIRSASSISEHEKSDEASLALSSLSHKHGVAISGHLSIGPDWSLDRCRKHIEQAIEQLREDSTTQVVETDDYSLEVQSATKPPGAHLRMTFPPENLWTRVATTLRRKASKAPRSGATWVFADVFNGLFEGTAWAALPENERATALRDMLLADAEIREPLHGVVLSDGAAIMRERPGNVAHAADSVIVAHEGLGGLRSRTVYAVAFTEVAARELDTWARMFDHSAPWLHWALNEFGLAIPRELAA